MYIFEGKDNFASVIYNVNSLTDDEKQRAIILTDLPEKQTIEGKTAILKADKKQNLVWWEYIDIVEDVPDTIPIIITKAQFLKRLTEDELNKVTNYEMFTTGTDKLQKDMYMKTLWKMFDNFEKVTISDAEWCQQFAQIVVWAGLITADRLQAILES